MKRNLLAVIILALTVVNIVLSAVTMFSVTSTNKKTAEVITAVASALQLELDDSFNAGASAVAMENTATFDITDSMTIPLKKGADGKDHYCVLSVSFAMNTQDEGYKTYGATISEKESLLKAQVIDVVGSYTLEEIQADPESIKQDVLDHVQNMFGSPFIYQVAFSDIKYS